MPEIFVSCNREDLKISQSVVDGLTAEGFNVWMDQNLQAGENYDEITEDRLHRARRGRALVQPSGEIPLGPR